MYLLRRTFNLFILKLCLVKMVLCEKISLKDGEVTYEFEYDENKYFNEGSTSKIYKGKRIDGDKSDGIVFKVARSEAANANLKHENDIYEMIGEHDDLYYLLDEFETFSAVTVLRTGLQVLNGLEFLHGKNVIHYNAFPGNWAVGLKEDSRIYIFDFGNSPDYEVVGDSIVFKPPFEYIPESSRSPSRDIRELAQWLLKSLPKNKPGSNDDTEKMYRIVEYREVLTKVFELAENPKSIKPDYEAFRQILQAELEEHKDKPNFNKFDWQN